MIYQCVRQCGICMHWACHRRDKPPRDKPPPCALAPAQSHEAHYYKIKSAKPTDFEKKSSWGSSTFTFINADTNKKLAFKSVKNAKEVFEFIEEKILMLTFPTGGHW